MAKAKTAPHCEEHGCKKLATMDVTPSGYTRTIKACRKHALASLNAFNALGRNVRLVGRFRQNGPMISALVTADGEVGSLKEF